LNHKFLCLHQRSVAEGIMFPYVRPSVCVCVDFERNYFWNGWRSTSNKQCYELRSL